MLTLGALPVYVRALCRVAFRRPLAYAVTSKGALAKRVGPSLTPLPPGAIIVAEPPWRRSVGRSGRSGYQRPRSRRLSPEQREAVRVRASNRPLREVATEFGVSHESVRAALCRPPARRAGSAAS